MSLESIPPTELAKYLNQIDMRNLSLINKQLNQYYKSCLEEIKKYISTRANRLSIYFINENNNSEYIVYYFHQTMTGKDLVNLILPRKFKVQNKNLIYMAGERALFRDIALFLAKKVKIKEGDIIEIIEDVSIISNTLIFDNSFTYIYEYTKGQLIKIGDNHVNLQPAKILLETYSIYHWSWSLNYVLYSVPNMYTFFDNDGNVIYVEINTGKFLFRVNCKKTKPTDKNYKSLLINHVFKEVQLLP